MTETNYPVTAPESDQDDAALADNAERVADGDWTPSLLSGNAANMTTNGTGGTVLRVGGGLATDSLNREQTALAPVLDPDRVVPEEPLTGDPGSTTGGVINGRS